MRNLFTQDLWICDIQESITCKGGGSGGGQNTVTNQSAPPAPVMQSYQTAVNAAQGAASQPLQQWGGPYIAGFTPDQTQAMSTINGLQGVANPYIDQARGLIQQGTQPLWDNVQQFSPGQVNQYMNPYTQAVTQATQAQFNNQNQQQNQQLIGNAISKGAWGGDRAGIAQAELANQQQLAQAPVIAGLQSQGYQQGLQEFNTQQQAQLGANEANAYLNQQGAFGLGNLGQEALGTGLTGASAQLQTGALQQQLGQEALNIPYEQFQQQQAYPFQTAQYFANIAQGIGGGMGGTSSTTSPSPSMLSQIGGLGLSGLGLAGQMGAFSGAGSGAFTYGPGLFATEGAADSAAADAGISWLSDAAMFAKRGGKVPHMASGGGMNLGILGNIMTGQDPMYGFTDNLLSAASLFLKNGGKAGYDDGGLVSPPDAGKSFIPETHMTPGGLGLPPPPPAYQDNSPSPLQDYSSGLNLGKQINAEKMDDGGMVGGIAPGSVSAEGLNPQMQAYYQRFQSMNLQQLQMAVSRMPAGSPMAAMAQKTLQQKRMMPNVGVPVQNGLSPPQGYDDGGDIPSQPIETAQPQGYTPAKVDPWQSVLTAGLGMMAGNSPFAGVNIGKGGLEGIKNYEDQRKQAASEKYQTGELGVRQQEAKARAQQLAVMAENFKSEAAHRIAEEQNWAQQRDLAQQTFDRGKFVPYTDITGNHGVFNTAKGTWETPNDSVIPPSPTGNKITKDVMDLSKKQLEDRDKTYIPSNAAQSDEITKNLTNVLGRYNLNANTDWASWLNRYSSAVGLDASNLFSSVMSPDDYKQVMSGIGNLKSAAMNGAKNVRNLREFNAITSPAELFGGGDMSPQSQLATLNAAAHSVEAEHMFNHTYYNKYHTLDGADTVWNEYNKNNDLVLRNKNGDPIQANPQYFNPGNINSYIENAPSIYQKAIGGKQGVPAQELPPVETDNLSITPNPSGPPMVKSPVSAPPPWTQGRNLQYSPSTNMYKDKETNQVYDAQGNAVQP